MKNDARAVPSSAFIHQPSSSAVLRLLTDRFRPIVALLALTYLVIELVYVTRLPLAHDEFGYASNVHKLHTSVPYRDFPSYRAVLGYYVMRPALALSDDPWTGLVLLRTEMALLNTFALAGAALVLARRFRRPAVLAGAALLVVMSTFLERSSVIRVDMIAAWLGLGSLLALFERRYALAGVAAALSFFVCPKGAYYPVAGGVGLATCWLAGGREREIARGIVRYVLAGVAVLVAYVGFWSCVSSFTTVVQWVFVRKFMQAVSAEYGPQDYGWTYWIQTVTRNPLFYGLGCASLVRLALRAGRGRAASSGQPPAGGEVPTDRTEYRDRLLLAYGAAMIVLCLSNRLPSVHFFLILIPTVFVLNVRFFQDELRFDPGRVAGMTRALFLLVAFFGIAYPLSRLRRTLTRSNAAQRRTVRLALACLDPGDKYVDGVRMIFNRRKVEELAWLDPVKHRTRTLWTISPEERRDFLERVDGEPVKLLILNYRLRVLPGWLKVYLFGGYTHLWGNVYIYGPRVLPSQRTYFLKFGGTYELAFVPHGTVIVDGREVREGDRVRLAIGRHQNANAQEFRLRFIPEGFEGLTSPGPREPTKLFFNTFTY